MFIILSVTTVLISNQISLNLYNSLIVICSLLKSFNMNTNISNMFINVVIFIRFIKRLNAFKLQILHLNDFHARFEPVDVHTSLTSESDVREMGIGKYLFRFYTLVTNTLFKIN